MAVSLSPASPRLACASTSPFAHGLGCDNLHSRTAQSGAKASGPGQVPNKGLPGTSSFSWHLGKQI